MKQEIIDEMEILNEESKQETVQETKDLKYYKNNAEEDYLKVPISVLRYISELEQQQHSKNDMINFAWWLTRNLGQFSDDKDAHFKGKYFDMWAKEIKKELS